MEYEELRQGLEAAFVDWNTSSNLAYKPQFISNDYRVGRKVLSSIEEELLHCDEFIISVAFITMSGIAPLLQTFKELEKSGVRGRILTTDYLHFSDPQAIRKLAELKNITIRMYSNDQEKEGFHTKGYFFKKAEIYRIIIGSSNMTQNALTRNREWNTKIVSTNQGEFTKDALAEFETLWNAPQALEYETFIEAYTEIYTRERIIRKQKEIAKKDAIVSFQEYTLRPNTMQVGFINNLKKIRESGERRALLISATGTGKTYASAFALRDINPKKALFLVHREQIAKQAIRSYRKVFGNQKSMGLLSGNTKEYEVDYLFATMQMMAKKEVREQFAPDEFQVIIIDEAHRTGAASYQEIMNYFKPEFWLGMTASPERTDSYDVFSVFDHNVAYEIRLQQAMEENLLCPFHYFGITDLKVDGEIINEKSDFNYLTSDVRVDYVLKQANYYGYSGKRVKGLVFCRNKKEAEIFSTKFNERGYRTVALSGMDSQQAREDAIERLVTEDIENALDYIFTVDIFNEGVDIPEVNQVIMLRPTESPIVFVQQLGRGLRNAEDKEYVVILDFIGNYDNNFMIPIALSGDRSYNKDTIRRYVMEGCRVLPGASTIHFDEISKTQIFKAIDHIKGIKSIIKKSYQDLKYRLGRVPKLIDFYENGEVDPILILDNYKTYYQFLLTIDPEQCRDSLSEQEILALEYLSKLIGHGKRPHEVELLDLMLSNDVIEKEQFINIMKQIYNYQISEAEINSAISNLDGMFVSKEEELEKYKAVEVLMRTETGRIERVKYFLTGLQHMNYRMYLQDLVQIAKVRLADMHKGKLREGCFVLYEKYSRRDVCQLLNCSRDLSSTMYGMKRIGDEACIFVTYHKSEDVTGKEYIEGKPDYADEFVNNQIFMWDSQIGRGPDSSYMQEVLTAAKRHLFIKKSDAEGADFYYMGTFSVLEAKAGEKRDNHGKMREITKVKAQMHQEIREDLLKYLESNV